MCAHPGIYCRTPEEGNNKDMIWCNKILERNHNCTLQVRSVHASKSNVIGNINSLKQELLYNSTIDLPTNATVISEADSGELNNYWHTEYQLVIMDITDTSNGPTL